MPVLQGKQLRDAGKYEQNVQGPPGLVMQEGQAEHRLRNDCPDPQPIGSLLKSFRGALYVHRPYKREQGEGHPAKRIHHRPGWRQKHRIRVVDNHGQKCEELDHIESCGTELARVPDTGKNVGY